MGLATIITLIILGILLILLELFVVPGITVAGVGGLVLLIVGMYFTYSTYGLTIGSVILVSLVVFISLVFFIAKKTGLWKSIALDTEIKSKSKSDISTNLQVGSIGKTVSRLAPMGKVMIDRQLYEASSNGNFIDENVEIEIIKIKNNKIIVKQKL